VEETLRDQEAQLRAAQRIQEHLLPTESPSVVGIDIAGASYPAEFAAGDHFDYFTMADGSVGVVIGDVSGHGFSSALLMASTHAHMRSLAEMNIGIDEIFSRANSSLYKQTETGNFVTASLVRLDPDSRVLTYVSAGHPAGVVIDGNGNVKAQMPSTSAPLAVESDTDFQTGSPITLEPNDIVILLTDGVLEAASAEDDFFGEERTLQFVRANRTEPAADIADGLCRAARDFCDRGQPQDDVTVVVIKVGPDTPKD
jgi:serine phosphatase RsbU (regulator of sigma subunit)